jgi:hypothetical protein
MQVLLQTRLVQEEESKAALLDVLADKYSRAILVSTLEMLKSNIDLSSECGIQISMVTQCVVLFQTQTIHISFLVGANYSYWNVVMIF